MQDDNAEIWNQIITLGGGKGVARFGVVSAASEDPCCDKDSSWVYYRDLLYSYGASYVYYIPVTVNSTKNNNNVEVVDEIRTLSGFFFGGGDQRRIIESFYNNFNQIPSQALLAIRETLLSSGGVVAGTSAGTDCQTSNIMITGGESYEALQNGATMSWNLYQPSLLDLVSYAPGGIGLFPHGLLDTHFENRGRQGRLLRLLSDSVSLPSGNIRAFGVDENTALVVTGPWSGRTGKIIGERGVMIFDIASSTIIKDSSWSIADVEVSHLTRGDTIDLLAFSKHPADYKTSLRGRESNEHAEISENIFQHDTFEFNKVATSLFNSLDYETYGETLQNNPKFVVAMSKVWDDSRQCEGYDGTDPDTGIYSISYIGMRVSISAKSTN